MFKSPAFLKGGPDLLRTRAATAGRIVQHLLRAYSMGDSYATVVGNSIASAAVGASDITSAGASGAPMVTTFSLKDLAQTSAYGTPTTVYVAIVDSVSSEVHLVAVTGAPSGSPPPAGLGGTFRVNAWTDTQTQPT